MWSTSNDQEQERFANKFKLLVATLKKVNRDDMVAGLRGAKQKG